MTRLDMCAILINAFDSTLALVNPTVETAIIHEYNNQIGKCDDPSKCTIDSNKVLSRAIRYQLIEELKSCDDFASVRKWLQTLNSMG